MKLLTLFLFIALYTFSIQAQNTEEKPDPILFGDLYLGLSSDLKSNMALLGGVSLNYQIKKNLITIRYVENLYIGSYVYKESMFVFPFLYDKAINRDFAALYGMRWVFENTSVSVSGGISANIYQFKAINETTDQI